MKQANLRAWASNSLQVQALPIKDDVVDKDTTVNILRLQWNTSTDTITFAPRTIASELGLISSWG